MILVGSMVPNFKQILFHFFCFLYQGHMGFIAISEISHFGLPKTIFTFSKNFLNLDPSLSPVMARNSK